MTDYFRPIAQTDTARPATAVPLAGHPRIWFDRVEHIARGREGSKLIPASECPPDILERLTAPRAPICGVQTDSPLLMGVLNTTPDSFSDGGRFDAPDAAVRHAAQMVKDGAHILDIGGESTRPGADVVAAPQERMRTEPIIQAIRTAGITTPISIDTRKAPVAQAALEAGADMLNDVSAFSYDPDMIKVARSSGAQICLMHAQGDPKTMQKDPQYGDVLLDVYDYLQARVAQALEAGIARSQIILDPGIGFGKTAAQNLRLIGGLSLFHALGCPILLGVSRKRFIGTIGNAEQADRRAPGSVAVALGGLSQAVQIIRAHDIEEHAQAFALWEAMLNQEQE